ncbi:MAG: hypothetical protein JWO36_7064 [Myxococcales bacterium]|nr:hypothetical protein [Myxococcales bacterium]
MTRARSLASVGVLVGTIGVAVLLSCGGTTTPDPCPTGSCDPQANTVVKWVFDHYPEWQFDSDSCVDFGVGKVHVEVTDSMGVVHTADDDCGVQQVTFQGLPSDTYSVSVTPRDFGGNPVVSVPATGMVQAATVGNNTSVSINVPWTSWIGTFTGTFLFRISWAGMSCAMASTPVVSQLFTLTIGGQVVTQKTDTNQKLDGTGPRPCRELTEQFPQSVQMVPFGPGTLLVVGQDGSGSAVFTHQFDVFSGAGISNPTVTYNVPGDAGVDAPPVDALGAD